MQRAEGRTYAARAEKMGKSEEEEVDETVPERDGKSQFGPSHRGTGRLCKRGREV